MSVSADLRRTVWQRAEDRCEYCQMPQRFDPATFEIDHIVPEKMDGQSIEANLALACFKCNNHKGPNIAGVDADTGPCWVRCCGPPFDADTKKGSMVCRDPRVFQERCLHEEVVRL